MAPHFTAGRYGNYLNADEVGEHSAVSAAFGPNGKRLREVKRRGYARPTSGPNRRRNSAGARLPAFASAATVSGCSRSLALSRTM